MGREDRGHAAASQHSCLGILTYLQVACLRLSARGTFTGVRCANRDVHLGPSLEYFINPIYDP